MARGVVGREVASDERNRQARIRELLLKALERLGMPVLREWHKAAHDTRKVTGGCFEVYTVQYLMSVPRRTRGYKRCNEVLRYSLRTSYYPCPHVLYWPRHKFFWPRRGW